MYFAVLVACGALHQCYRLGLYAHRPFATKLACEAAFSYVDTNYMQRSLTLHVVCMTTKELEALPEYRKRKS